MVGARIVAVVFFTLVLGSALTCRSATTCTSDGQISVSCVEKLVSGFRPPDVPGYAVKAAYAELSGQQVRVMLQYAPSNLDPLPVVVTVQHDQSPTGGVQGDLVENLKGLQVASWENGGVYAAATVVDGVRYQVEVLGPPGFPHNDPEMIRSRFVDSIASTSITH